MKKGLVLCMCLFTCILFFSGCDDKKESQSTKCEEGSFLVDGSCKKASDVKDAIISYACPEGFTISEDKLSCSKTDVVEAKNDNPCPSDYDLQGGKCVKTETVDVEITPSCAGGNGTLNADKTKCTYRETKAPKTSTVCPSGYYIYGFECLKRVHGGFRCYTGEVYDARSNGCLNIMDSKQPETKTECLTGYNLEGSTCVRTYELTALQNKSCPSGFKSSGNKCVKTTKVDVTGTYYCEDGYTLNNTTCSKDIKQDSTKSYSCESNDYSIIDNKCVKFN